MAEAKTQDGMSRCGVADEEYERISVPNLRWVRRRQSHTPYWRVEDKTYPDRSVSLVHLRDHPEKLRAKCVELTANYKKWKAGVRGHVAPYDGTLGYLLKKYRDDAESTFHSLRPASRHPYEFYLRALISDIGDRRIDSVTGLDLKRWHEGWSGGGERLAASKMMRAVLDAAITFSVMSAKPNTAERRAVAELREALKAASRKLPNPKRRESVITADQVVALRANAHKDGRASHALAYALVFETTLRLWDVIGQWWPLDAPLISDVTARYNSMKEGKKWFGLRWEDIGPDLVLRYVPSKTSAKTGLAVTFPLARAPMVMEELCWWPEAKRAGPVILNAGSGLPFSGNYFGEGWRRDRKAAGIDSKVWARDLRASGITEGRAAGTATDDVAKVAGHASTKTTSAVYDRATLEAAERMADARSAKRKKKA